MLHMRVFRHWRRDAASAAHLLLVCLAGRPLLLFGDSELWCFALLYVPISFCGGAIRSPSTELRARGGQGRGGHVC